MPKRFYEKDGSLAPLAGKTVAIIGYGSQGHAHALNLRDSGINVVVGLYEGSKSKTKAESAGLKVLTVGEAAKAGDFIMVLLPDHVQGDTYRKEIEPNLKKGKTLMFAHGFNIHFGEIKPPADIDVSMIAPKAPGHRVRELFTEGVGVPALVAIAQDASGKALENALAYALALGCLKAGFRVGKKENKLGMRSSATGEVIFTDCRLPPSQLLGKPGEGFVDSLRILDGGRISIAALSVGTAQGAYEAALRYSKQRKQFGRFISEFQAIQHKLADMATSIDAARLLVFRAAAMKDTGERVTKESSMAKLFASEMAVRVCDEALQIHGGYGFIKDYPVEKFYRDVKLCTIGEGTSEIQRLVIARQLLKE
jgi:hypothetical protein